MMDNIKVAVVRVEGEHEQPAKVWRYSRQLIDKYQLLQVEEELIRYYLDIEEQKLGLVSKYQDSLLETKITIESDTDLRVSSKLAI